MSTSIFPILYLMYLYLGGLSIVLIVDHFRDGKYYWFGVHLLNSIAWITMMLRLMIKCFN